MIKSDSVVAVYELGGYNGDSIVFKGTYEEYEIWTENQLKQFSGHPRRSARMSDYNESENETMNATQQSAPNYLVQAINEAVPTKNGTIDKVELRSTLQKGKHHISFIKKDGTVRQMIATLDQWLIPESHQPKSVGNLGRTENPNVLAVFDLEVDGWRSVTVDKVIAFYDIH
jgi:hypothetical protein